MGKRLLWIGDACVSTGFARATHKTLPAFIDAGWDVHVLGLNYDGDPHNFPYPVYPASGAGSDPFGVRRTPDLVTKLRPSVVVVQNDPWNLPRYMKAIGNVPVVATLAVDGKNCAYAQRLNGLTKALFWTEFGLLEARLGGYTGPAGVVPLGVDLGVYKPIDRKVARAAMGLPAELSDAFIVGNVNRNQPRKRLDLTIQYFAEWVKSYGVDDAYLFLHVAPTGDLGYDVAQLMKYYGLSNRLIEARPQIGHGIDERKLVYTYGCFNVQVSTSQGEGWGLTTAEGMACGIPQIVPDWAALGEWVKNPLALVPCDTISVTPNYVNAIGGLPNKQRFISKLDLLYRNQGGCAEQSRELGLEIVNDPKYRWENIATKFLDEVEEALSGPSVLEEVELASER